MKKAFVFIQSICVIFALLGCTEKSPPVALIDEDQYKTFYRISRSPLMKLSKAAAWERTAPGVREVFIHASIDGTRQPALFYNSGSARKKPLLVVLHSWQADYRQHSSIPYGIWAIRNDWIFIHPDYRGPYTNSSSTASDFSVRDIIDAVEFARKNARVDESRIYLSGFSGGGMTALIMAGRYPDLWAGVVAWVPVYDLARWYKETKGSRHDYSRFISDSCGGPPLPGTSAEKECRKRSAATYLKNAKGKKVRIYVATGIKDDFVPVSHSICAYNDLAASEDAVSREDIDYMSSQRKLPPGLLGFYTDRLYADAEVPLLFERRSGNVTLKIFNGRHDTIYNAELYWLSLQKRK